MSAKSPLKDYSRYQPYQSVDRTVKKEQVSSYRMRNFDTSDRIAEQLKIKLQLSLKQNTKLLDENAALSELVSKLRYQTKELNQRVVFLSTTESNNLNKVQMERETLMNQIQIKQITHENEMKTLLEQISRLHKEKNQIQILSAKGLEKFKIEHEKNTETCVQALKSSQENAKDLYETQIRKLKQALQNQQRNHESLQAEQKIRNLRLESNVNSLEEQIKHIKKLHSMEIHEIINTNAEQFQKERRTIQRQKQIQASNQGLNLKRLKNQLLEKDQQISSLSKRMSNNENMHSLELEGLKREKQQLLSELNTAEVAFANKAARDKAKLKELNELEVKNILQLNETHIGELKNEINHLKNLLDAKSVEIRRLFQENSTMKKSYDAQISLQQKSNNQLRIRMKALQRDNLQQMQAFKVKIATLIDADMKALVSFYQNQVALLQTNIINLEEINKANKQNLYKSLQDNDQIRKNFQIQISKQKARVQDLKIKLAALNLEHKEQVTSLATKMELTSQTLVRQADQKNKSQVFFDEEKKKFHNLSHSKDKQIADLLETMHRMKKMHESELTVLRTEKNELRDQIEGKDDEIIRVKLQFEQDLKQRQQKMKRQTKPEDEKQKLLIKELYDKNEALQNQNIKLQKQVEHLARQNRTIAGQLGLKKGFIETLQLESCAAIEDEKSKLRTLMGNSELSLKEYFEDKLLSKEKDIEHLQKVLAGKEEDIRDLIVKYNGLEKRLETLLSSQDKLRLLDQKVKNLGLDNNLVKNMAELFNRPNRDIRAER